MGDIDAGAPDAPPATGDGAFGDPCDDNADCESALCYRPDDMAPGTCTQECMGMCPDGYACRTVPMGIGEVTVCVPASDTFCQPCTINADCGDTSDLCVEMTEGRFCTIDCEGMPSVCPVGFVCQEVSGAGDLVVGTQCIPNSGICCVDGDGDQRGIGAGCRTTDCDDDNPAVYDDADEVCDGFDNDCAGGVDVDVTDCVAGACNLGMLGYYEDPAEVCESGACVAGDSELCGLYTCDGGGSVGDACATACDVEDDGKCIPDAHCDASVCLDDLVNGEVCDEDSDCASDHCQNGFCCNTGDCCTVPEDCPAFGTFDPVCEDPATCQGSVGDSTCVNNTCGTTGDTADDSGCDATVEADKCGWYLPVFCTGAVDQTAPECPTSCSSHADCDAGGHCDPVTSTCIEDLVAGEACGADAERCKSGYCGNGFCCAGGDCCSAAADCPPSYSSIAECLTPTACQGERDFAECIANQCSTNAGADDDSGCGAGILAVDCGPYLDIYCDGSITQTPPVCPTACATDAECDPGAYCGPTSACVPDQPNGGACNDSAECQSGHCGNGFCCASGDCCADNDDCNSYDQPSVCQSQSTCQGTATEGICTASFQCTASGTAQDDSGCAGLESNACGLYPSVMCTTEVDQPTDQASRCSTTCGTDADCDPSARCEGMLCVPRAGQGGACMVDGDCDAGLLCRDGVCCDSDCSGSCRACNLAGSLGTCTFIPDGSDPQDECGAVGCAGYYGGWSGDTCLRKADVTAPQARCGGDGMCRSQAEECTAQTSTISSGVTCDDTCQNPNGATCTGTIAPVCTNVPGGTLSCGVGACYRTVPECVGGMDNTCTAGSPTTETCNGIDDDCNGTIDNGTWNDVYESNNTCGSRYPTGTQNEGDPVWSPSSQTNIHSSGDVDWYFRRTLEADDVCVPFTTEGTYYFRTWMTPPAGEDYDLEVCWEYRDDSSCTLRGCATSTLAGSAQEYLYWYWNGTCGSEDGLDFYIHVYPWAGANSCYPYTIQTQFTKE